MTDHKTLGAALAAAQANMKDPRLTGTNPHFDSKFVPRDEALDCVLPALLAEGLALSQVPCSDERGVGVRTLLFHAATGEVYDFGPFTVKPQKDDPQGAVAATTYASRTALMLIFGRAGDPDDDGNAACEKPKPEPQAEKKPQPVSPSRLKELRDLREKLGVDDDTYAAQLVHFDAASDADLTDEDAKTLIKAYKGRTAGAAK